jgi:SPP1 gp7 family putative phage head morphogenesis protein
VASTRSILSAAKAAAPAGRPTPGPQGSAPYFGSTSPLVQQLDVANGYASAYGNFLPRPASTFTQGAFGPFSPILPVPVDTPTESGRADPRRTPYEPGWNLPVGEPGSEGVKLATFGTLKTLADLYSVARACIQLRKAEVRSLNWDIMPTSDAAKANKGNAKWFRDFGERRAQAVKFFRKPDPDYFSWSSFVDAALEEVFVFDALSLHIRPKRGKRAGMRRGLLGSDLDSLELISGPTIRPLYDIRGSYPRPPAPAYQQYLYGVPRSDLMQMVDGHDVEESGISDSLWGQYRSDQLMYLPMVPRRFTPYGFPPVERALIPIMSGLQKQGWQLDWFREGTVPAIYLSPGDESMTPNQIRELQDAINAFAGDPAWHHKVLVLPPNSKVMPQRDAQLADQFDEIVMSQVCMAFEVMPMELGITPKVSTTVSPGASNQMAKMTSNASDRKGTKPLLMHLSEICNTILQVVCGQDDMEFIFEGLQEEEDQEQLTGLLIEQVTNGLRSVDEARDELNLQPWGLPETSGPVFLAQTGPVAFDLSIQQQVAQVAATQAAPAITDGTPAEPKAEQDVHGGTVGGTDQGSAAKPAPKPGATPAKPGTKPVAPAKPAAGQAGTGHTPGHEAAQASDTVSGRGGAGSRSGASASNAQGTGNGSGKPATGNGKATDKITITVGLAKAVTAELEALTRHLRKGRLITTWVPKNVPQNTLARISENISRGLDIDQAVTLARMTTLDVAGEGEAAPKARKGPVWPGWSRDQKLADTYVERVAKALRDAVSAIVGSGGAALNAAREAMVKALTPVLHALWREAWVLGDRSAQSMIQATAAVGARAGVAGSLPVDWGEWTPGDPESADLADSVEAFQELLQGQGVADIKSIADTDMEQAVAEIRSAVAGGDSTGSLARRLRDLVASPARADMIARTEVARLVSAGSVSRYRSSGITEVIWVPASNDVCILCQANADEGAIPIGDSFTSGAQSPPQHPACRCVVAPAAIGGVRIGSSGAEDVSDDEADSIDELEDDAGGDGSDEGGDSGDEGDGSDGEDTSKAVRRTVPLTGEVLWTNQDDAEPNAAGGGGQSPVRHWADGTQAPPDVAVTGGVPGSSAGGEPPRWDTPVANGYQGGLNDLSDRRQTQSIQGGNDGLTTGSGRSVDVHTRSKEPYPTNGADRWPAGGHGTDQAPGGAVPGNANDRGRAPGTTGKAAQPIAAGVAVVAGDTGRVLMLQRAANPTHCTCGMPIAWDESNGWQHTDGSISHGDDTTSVSDRMGTDAPDPAAGQWEFPGGCLEDTSEAYPDGEDAATAARREWQEETGVVLPVGQWSAGWVSSNGVYQGFVLRVDHESDVPISEGRDRVVNPDDPDGDVIEALAWWNPDELPGSPVIRTELAADLDRVLNAITTQSDKAEDLFSTLGRAFGQGPAGDVLRQLARNFDLKGLGWVLATKWSGPQDVPLEEIDFGDEDSWAAHHQDDRVQHFVDKIRAGEHVNPAILVRTPRGTGKLKIVDGHHRVMAWQQLKRPVTAYIGDVPRDTGPWDETHLYQEHQGDDPGNG